jgi:hypothetical protein
MASNAPPIVQPTVQDAIGNDRGEGNELKDLPGFRRTHLCDISPRCSVPGCSFQEPAGPFVPLNSSTAQLHLGGTHGHLLLAAGPSAEDRFGSRTSGQRRNTSPG